MELYEKKMQQNMQNENVVRKCASAVKKLTPAASTLSTLIAAT